MEPSYFKMSVDIPLLSFRYSPGILTVGVKGFIPERFFMMIMMIMDGKLAIIGLSSVAGGG